MKRFFLLTILLILLLPAILGAEQEYLEVTAPANRALQLAIAPPVAVSGGPNQAISGEIAELFRFDLTLAGPFAVQGALVAEGKSGIRLGSFDFAPWKSSGADLLLKTGFSLSDSKVVIECRLYDVAKETELTARRYTGNIKDLRRMGHTFSDEVMRVITRERGPFNS